MLTLSLCNILASFFHSMPICGAFTRSAVSNASGVRTPFSNFYSGRYLLYNLQFEISIYEVSRYFYMIAKNLHVFISFSALITIFALTFLTPSFRFIPKTTLAAVLIAAVIFLVDIQIITPLWKCCSKFVPTLTLIYF